MNLEKFENVEAASKHLVKTFGGNTITNYMPFRDSILLMCKVQVTAIQVAQCKDANDLINQAFYNSEVGVDATAEFKVIATSPEFSDKIHIGDYVDLKNVSSMSRRPVIAEQKDVMSFVDEFKKNNRSLLIGSGIADGKKSKVVDFKAINEGSSDFAKEHEPTDIIEISFPAISNFSNIDGIYIKPSDINSLNK